MKGTRPYTLIERHRIEERFHVEWAKSIDLNYLLASESFEAEIAIKNRLALGDMRMDSIMLPLKCRLGV